MKSNYKKKLNKKIDLAISAGLLISTPFYATTTLAAEKMILSSTFENGTDGWSSMGKCTVMRATWTKHNGNSSLYVGNRKAKWNGALYNLKDKVHAGNTYNISTYWMSCRFIIMKM